MKEADKKVWIVPGKIRVASVFFALIVAAVVTTSVVMGDVQRKERAVQEHLAEEVLRFHVLANSDSRTDQAVKMEVRDAVLSYLKEVLPEELDVKETTRWMRGHTEEIRQVAEQKMADLQMQQTVSVAVTTCYFPDRTYGDVTFPAGNYKTLRIELGDAAGHNWWCVMFPPLCLPAAQDRGGNIDAFLDGDELKVVESSGRYEPRFKIVEIIEELREKASPEN